MAHKALVVEDEGSIRELLSTWLEEAGYEVRVASDGLDGLKHLYEFRPDVVIADILMPRMDGFEFCRVAREVCQAPILILSGLGGEAEKVRGLNLGADDYVVKPIGMDEFLARVGALLRRRTMPAEPGTLRYQDGLLTVDPARHEVLVRGQNVPFTPTEFRLLRLLTSRAGRTCTTREILDEVWPSPHYSPEVVKWHIASLRNKLEPEPGTPRHIVTVWGVGYRYDGVFDGNSARDAVDSAPE